MVADLRRQNEAAGARWHHPFHIWSGLMTESGRPPPYSLALMGVGRISLAIPLRYPDDG